MLLFSQKSWCQNLVPNPSFEKYKTLPCGFLSVIYNTNVTNDLIPDNIANYVENWYTPTSGTTDYWFFNNTIPRNQNGKDCTNGASIENNQPSQARTGSGYIGLYVTYSGSAKNYREYAQVRLTKPLKQGYYYHVSFYAQISNNVNYCSNQLGALFSQSPIIRPTKVDSSQFGEPLLFTPQIMPSEYICQPRQWVEVSKCFQASGGEEFLTIGNFFDDAHTFLQKKGSAGGATFCYYLIDDITVEEVGGPDFLPSTNFLGPDTVLCTNQHLNISIPYTDGAMVWSDGNMDKTRIITQSGTYIATITNSLCKVSDSVHVQVVPKLNLLSDTIICRGEVYNLTVSSVFGQISWDDNSSDTVRLISREGHYKLKTTYGQCVQLDSIHVNFVDCPGTVPNVITPNGDGKNDTFYIENITYIPWELTIYNRWGTKVYYTDYYKNEWDAAGNSVGLYYYTLREIRSNKIIKGWITVIR
ncbi:hypothetical protein GCM10028807_36220 [Spirosoma daeguense]